MNYENLAKEILQNIGGTGNVKHVTHCATRLRFNLIDENKADSGAIKKINGVTGTINKGGQFQVVIGTDVSHAYDEIIKMTPVEDYKVDDITSTKKENIINRCMDTIAGIFTPVLPAITGAAMIKTLLILLVNVFHIMSTKSPEYTILTFTGDAAFYFLPIMLAYTSAKKFGMNPFMAMTLGGIMLHPTFMALVNASSRKPLSFIGLPVTLANYASTVIPIILVIWVGSYVERFADKISPKIVRFFLKPFLIFLIMMPVTLVVVGPIGAIVASYVASGMGVLYKSAPWLVPFLLGAFSPLLVMTGMHYALIPIVLQSMTTYHFDLMGVGYLVANVAQGAAALAVAKKTRNKDFKSLAGSVGFTALLGITEPAMYGVNIKLKKPFYSVLIAGGVAGLYCGITSVKRLAFAPTGILTLPIFIDPKGSGNLINAIIGCVIAFVIAFTLTLIFGFEDVKESEKSKL
jgi:beta-glucoside PTS system EIICBA component